MKIIRISMLALFISTSVYGKSERDPLLEKAPINAASGDLEAETALYNKAIKQNSQNIAIRRELANVLIDANIRESQAELLEVIDAIEQGV